MQPFPQLSILGNPPPMMMGFDMNNPLFQPRPQLYDTHVPIVSGNQRKNRNQKHNNNNNKKIQNQTSATDSDVITINTSNSDAPTTTSTSNSVPVTQVTQAQSSKNKEELDDLAMLGIDASDVGAGI